MAFILLIFVASSLSTQSCALSVAGIRRQHRRGSSSKSKVSVLSALTLSDEIAQTDILPIDNRPHEQRVAAPRNARRLNHAFQHLYRHSDPRWDDNDWNDEEWLKDKEFQQNASLMYASSMNSNSTTTAQPINRKAAFAAIHYLHVHAGYSLEEIQNMHTSFPPLFEIDVKRHLRPKVRFLKDCMQGGSTNDNTCTKQVISAQLKAALPASFFGARFERTIAPRHAFLMHAGLPYGPELWNTSSDGEMTLFEEFLLMHRKPKQFAAMCNTWRGKYRSKELDGCLPFTSEQIVAFDKLFQRGLLSAARNDVDYVFPDEMDGKGNNKNVSAGPSPLTTANVTSAQLIHYMIKHGGNPYEEDVRGASLFHWAAGCGNLDGLKELVNSCNQLDFDRMGTKNDTATNNHGYQAALLWKASRDDATPFHWAAAGSGPKEFGTGGHAFVCNYLLDLCKQENSELISERKLINSQTKDGNTVLMWAAWSKSLDVVKLLVRNRADTTTTNRNGCSVAHWAASGGSLDVCKYLVDISHVDFAVENFARNTPLSHAVAYGRSDVVKWLREEVKVEDKGGSAADLALDFVNWYDSGLSLIGEEEGNERRKVFDLFKDWIGEENELRS